MTKPKDPKGKPKPVAKRKRVSRKAAPRKGISPAAYAKRVGLSRQTIMEQIEKRLLVKSVWKEGRYWKLDPTLADKERAANVGPQRVVKAEDQVSLEDLDETEGRAPSMEFIQARTLTEESRAALERIKLLERKGELISAAEVEKERFQQGRVVRDALLALPARIAPELANMTDAKAIAIFLQKNMVQALQEIVEDELVNNS